MPLTSTSFSYVRKHAHQLSFLFLRKGPFVRVADARSPHPTQLPKGYDPFSSRIIHSHSHPSVAMASTNAFLSPSFTFLPNRASDPIFLPPSYPLTPSSSLRFTFHHYRRPVSRNMNILYASAYDFNAIGSASLNSSEDLDKVPMPVVLIDQDSDSGATIVQIGFGDRLGALIDTMKALKDLGLAVSKGTVSTEGSVKQTKFFITQLDTGRKVEDPDMLERIRLTIIGNLLKYHPESSALLAMGEVFGIKAPEKKLDIDIATNIQVKEDGPKRSLLCIETADRPGLLVEIISVIADINIDVESAEIETEGLVAKDKFHVSYGGAALNNSMSQVLVNCLRYYLRRPETDIDSY